MKNATIIILSVLVTLMVLYFIFKKKIDTFLGLVKDNVASRATCDKQFYVRLNDGTTQAVHNSNVGTEDAPELKYYKNDVTFTEDGVTGATAPVEITKEEFEGLCKFKYNPPYEWYTVNTSAIVGHRK